MAKQSEVILQTLHAHGFEAYWVGGCVRDELMGRAVHDMDLTTSAHPEEIIRLFEHTIPTGIQHGTITVMMEGQPFEVTTYRVEGTYIDHRRPDEVTFVKDIKEDLQRRDFTMNAIARDLDGTYIDPFDGLMDTRRGKIRCVGNPLERFDEDALRMVRCVRFASVFGYSIAKNTWKGLCTQRSHLQYIAMERIRVEIEKVMSGEDPLRGFELLNRSRLLEFAKVPVLCSRFDSELLSRIHELSAESVHLRWGLLLYAGNFNGNEARTYLKKWTFSNQKKDDISSLIDIDEQVRFLFETNNLISLDDSQRLSWISIVLQSGLATAKGWLEIQGVIPEHRRVVSTYDLTILAVWTSQMRIHHLKQLVVSGGDIMQTLKMPSGPWLREMLQHLLLVVSAGIVENTKESLMDEMKRVNKNHG
ncbi:hypothetical protein PNBC_10695 [Paenibacillus crassostreae]|uniref:CCA tRNA nucleotidyltransferase n=2 Tax=Paenibacillus crassostreae TaxID=1763538 RepID=A0A167DXP1_9BACL|nr:hypothetical protein LPB68_03265 [Paenibacillus crassostreae]OAB74898.1 hypothetical protein PNBC_10695 [Paenibacillus crassostreae]